jgi:uncharacterized protein (TIGR00725 family)
MARPSKSASGRFPVSISALTPRARQLAIIGSSSDLAIPAEIELAVNLGEAAARRGLVCVVGGDDGVMGAAARAAKKAGGTVLAVLPRQKTLVAAEVFDAVVDTGLGWVQFSDAMLRSCCGVVVIGGGAGTLAELAIAYLTELPAAFLGSSEAGLAARYGNRSLDDRRLAVFEVVTSAEKALDAITGTLSDADAAIQRADEDHFSSYPFGDRSAYLSAAQLYRTAAIAARTGDERPLLAARYEDALGDYYYYDAEDFLSAASHYARARAHLGASTGDDDFRTYLEAIALESIAFGLADLGDHALASVVAEESGKRYESRLDSVDEPERAHLLHSAAGLRGDAAYYAAVSQARSGQYAAARASVERARREYQIALNHHPAWADGATSDTYARAIDPVDELADQLDALERGT